MSTPTRAPKAGSPSASDIRESLAEWLQAFVKRARSDVAECDALSHAMIWDAEGPLVWNAQRLVDRPCFYPLYRWETFYSYSPLALLLRKGSLSIDREVVRDVAERNFVYHSGLGTLDADIRRVGGVPDWKRRIQRADEYVRCLAEAICEDVAEFEARNSGMTNIVLCGGKDSLNLLLLPWRNPTKVASADPNYPYVQRFVEENRLDLEVVRLEDFYEPDVLDREILLNFCRVNLTHWRWGAHLAQLASEHDGNLVFWKGQLADMYTTDKWKVYTHPFGSRRTPHLKALRRAEQRLPSGVTKHLGRPRQKRFMETVWCRGAMMQGAHMGFIRELTGALALSAYHGKRAAEVLHQVDLAAAVQRDLRQDVGRLLAGRDVRYPEANPAPPPSEMRQGLHVPSAFLETLSKAGFPVE